MNPTLATSPNAVNLRQIRPWQYALPTAIALLMVASSLWREAKTAGSAAEPTQIKPFVAPLPQNEQVKVFFNQAESSVYTDPYRQITRHGDDLEQVIVSAIERADSSIDIAVQALNLPRIAEALIARHQAGVPVRLILENQYAQPWSQAAVKPDAKEIDLDQIADWRYLADTDRDGQTDAAELASVDAILALRKAGVPWIDDTADGSKGSGLMHHKFLVIDQRWVVTGSANFTLSGIHGDAANPNSRGNANVLIELDSPVLAQQMTSEFDLMWGDGPGLKPDSRFGLKKPARPAVTARLNPRQTTSNGATTSELSLQFSPLSQSQPWDNSVNGLIARTLAKSTQSIDLALFVFSEQKLANQLELQSAAGTELRVLIDPSFIYRSYSEALDLLGQAIPDRRCKIEADNHPWQSAIASVGAPQMPVGDKLHHKFAVIDRQTVIVGSQNWSHAANTQNDETLLVITNPMLAAHFSREFERLYRTAKLESHSLQRQIENAHQRCP